MMQSILDNTLPEYNLGLDSKLNDINDVYESINFIMECEKIYDFQLMINDDGKQRWYDKSLFITLEEWRDQKLNEILKEE